MFMTMKYWLIPADAQMQNALNAWMARHLRAIEITVTILLGVFPPAFVF